MADDLKALQDQIKQLRKEYQEIVGKPAALFDDTNIKNAKAAVDTLTKAIKEAENEAFKLEGGFAGLRKEILEIGNEFKKRGTDIKEITRLYSKVDKIAQDLKYDEAGISELTKQELKTRVERLGVLKQELLFKGQQLLQNVKGKIFGEKEVEIRNALKKNLIDEKTGYIKNIALAEQISKKHGITGDKIKEIAENVKDISDEEAAILIAYKNQFKEVDRLSKQAAERYEEEKKLEKSLGLVGGILKGISKIPIIGDIVDAEEALTAMKDAGGGIKGLKAGLSNLKTQFIEGITNPANLAVGAITQIFLALQSSDLVTGDLAKSFNITYNQAVGLRNELIQIGNLSGDVALNARALQETLIAVGQSLGSNAKLNQEDLKTFTELREKAGLTNEELVGMQNLTSATGGNLEDNVKNLMFAAKATSINNKVLLNEKDIMRDISKTSNAIKLSLAGNPELLGKAAAQAKALGMNLEQVDKIADSLLNFEQSISSELEAELLTGRDLNLEQARLYALNNDIEGLSREIAKNFGSAADFSKMNRLQQEAIAKSVGMSREELAKTLIDKEALSKMSEKDPELARKTLEFARQKGMTDKEISELKSKDFEDLKNQMSVQDRFNKTIEKLKEIFVSLVEPLLPVLDTFMSIIKPVAVIAGWLGTAVGWIGKMIGSGPGMIAIFSTIGLVLLPKILSGIGSIGRGLAAGVKSLKDMVSASIDLVKNLAKGNIAGMFSPKPGERFAELRKKVKITSKSPEMPETSKVEKTGGFLKGINTTDMIKGASAILILSGALFVAAKAFQQFADVKWKDMGKAAAAITGLAIVARIIGAPPIIGFIEAGAFALASLGISLIPLAIAARIATPAIQAFGDIISKVFSGLAEIITAASSGISEIFTTLGNIDIAHLLLIGPALLGIGAGLTAFGVGGAIGAVGGAIAKFFGGGPLEQLNSLAKLGDPLQTTAKALQNISLALNQMFSSLEKINVDKLKAIEEFSKKSLITGLLSKLLLIEPSKPLATGVPTVGAPIRLSEAFKPTETLTTPTLGASTKPTPTTKITSTGIDTTEVKNLLTETNRLLVRLVNKDTTISIAGEPIARIAGKNSQTFSTETNKYAYITQ